MSVAALLNAPTFIKKNRADRSFGAGWGGARRLVQIRPTIFRPPLKPWEDENDKKMAKFPFKNARYRGGSSRFPGIAGAARFQFPDRTNGLEPRVRGWFSKLSATLRSRVSSSNRPRKSRFFATADGTGLESHARNNFFHLVW